MQGGIKKVPSENSYNFDIIAGRRVKQKPVERRAFT